MLDIFVSYSRRNLDFVERLTNDLEQASKKIWFDKKKEPLAGIPAGSRWWDEIKHGIETADNFLFVLGPQSIQSPYCNAEIAHALHHNKRIVTLLYCADASQAETLQAINSAINEIPADDQLPHTVSADIHSVRSLARRNWLELSQIQFVVYANVRDWNQWLQTVVDAVDLDIQWIRQWGQFQQAVQIWIESGYDDAYLWAEPRRKLIREIIESKKQVLSEDETKFITSEEDVIIAVLSNENVDEDRYQYLMYRLKEIGGDVVLGNIATLKNSQSTYGLLYKVVSEVGKLQDSRVLESLFKLLKSDKVENDDIHLQRIKAGLRAKSAQVLGELGDANATLPLIDVLQNDSDEKVRQSAVEALSKLKDAQAVDPLIDALVNDDDIEVRISVASALCELRDVRALEPLIETLQSSDNYRLRLEVITALAIFEDKRVVDLLNAILESDSNLTLRSRAAMVLGDLKDKPSEVNLRHALYNDTSAEVRHYALLALYKLEVSLHKELKSFDDKKVIDLLSAVLSSRFALEEKVQSVEVLRLMEHPMAQEAVRRWDDGDYSFLG